MARETLGSTAANARYMAHPAGGSASSYVDDGSPLDAATAFVITNNLNHLRNESGRHLFTDVYRGAVNSDTADGRWGSLNEDVPPAAQRAARAELAISWDRRTARKYGPFPQLIDRQPPGGSFDLPDDLPRKIKFAVRVLGDGANAHKLYLAVTAGPRAPTDGALAFTSLPTAGVFANAWADVTATLEPTRGGQMVRPAELPSSVSPGVITHAEFYLWVGWKHAGAGTFGILNASAWEVD